MTQPPQTPPRLTDLKALALHRRRADMERGMFLQTEAIEDIKDRLSLVNRDFTSPAIITGFPDLWQKHFPNALVVPDNETLALSPNSHDLAIHAMALHWANDPVGQLIQARHALKEDGLFIAACFGGQTLSELRSALAEAETATTGGMSPRILPMGDIRDFGALLQRAGFALPVADSFALKATYESPWQLMRDLRAMGENNALAARARRFTRRAILAKAAEIYATHYSEDDRVFATFELLSLTGWKPHETQPKPLRPGTATARLSDALGTKETKL